MEDIKITATYRDGALIPNSPLNLENGSKVEVILSKDLYSAFSLASEDSGVEDFFYAQKEVVDKNE
jgi:predicted DNA-binding antitoxin AbrB/MazE fold protein